MIKNLLVLAAVCSLASSATAQGWANFKPGAFSKLKTTSLTETAGMKIKTVTVMKSTLKDINATEATIETETESSTEMNGAETKMPAQKSEMKIPLATTAPAATASVSADAAVAGAKVTTTNEKLTVSGKELNCTVSSADVEAGGSKTTTKQWVCDDVPGAIVKSESSTTGPATSTMTMELLEFDAKK